MNFKHLLATAVAAIATLTATQSQAVTPPPLNVQHAVLSYVYQGADSVIGYSFNLASTAIFPFEAPVAFNNLFIDGTFYAAPNGYWNSFNLNSGSTSLSHLISFDAVSPGVVQFQPTFSWITKPGAVVNFVPATTVPEPESYALMLAGLGALGLMSKRRKLG